ncbi:transposase [Persicobacter diffluens]|uniref:transposase n=1 Tax=Persicobacter diffluens TaxID=981 RepID=UPI003B9826B4
MAQWHGKTEKSGFKPFESLKAIFYESSEKIVNYFKLLNSNAAPEFFNAKL